MRTLELEKCRRARVWLGELPAASFNAIQIQRRVFDTEGVAAQGRLTRAAVELTVPRGGWIMYGLLGGGFEANLTGRLTVDLGISPPNERFFGDSLAEMCDEVRVGLPAEYAQGVLTGLDCAKTEFKMLIAGTLSINCAAHGAVGSCNLLFKHLSTILIKLFVTASVESTDEELARLFPSTFA